MRRRGVSLIPLVAGIALIVVMVTMMTRSAAATGLAGAPGWAGLTGHPSAQRPLTSRIDPGHASANHVSSSQASSSSAAASSAATGPAVSACSPWSLTTNQSPNEPALYSAAAISATNVWAVGTYYNTSLIAHRTLVEHYNGSTWSVVVSPSSGTVDNSLQRVTAISPNDIWAVGVLQNVNQGYQTLAEHWDGAKWSIIPTPTGVYPTIQYGYDISGVSAVASNDVWAVWSASQPIVERWDGSKWSVITVPMPSGISPTFSDIVALTSSDVWVVGSYFNQSTKVFDPLFAHWDGTNWTVNAATIPGWYSGYLNRVVAISNSDIWTVGYGFPTSSSNMETLTEHWNGSTWSLVSSPNPGGWPVSLNDVAAVSSNNVWAVGDMSQYAPIYRLPVVLHWDGRAWNVVSTPPTNTYSILWGVTAITPLNVFAVGEYILNPQPGVSSKVSARAATTETNEYLIEKYNPLISTACK